MKSAFVHCALVTGLAVLLTLSPLRGPGGSAGVSPVAAQSDDRPQTLMELFFRRNNQSKSEPAASQPARRATSQPAAQPRATTRRTAPKQAAPVRRQAAPAPEPVETETAGGPVEKLDNARTVLVIGDFIADGMADGLQEAFADVASVSVLSRPNGSSGLVRDDFYDWPAEIGPILDEVQPQIVVVMLGSNDRQAMRVDGSTRQVRSEAWTAEYKRRVEALVAKIRDKNVVPVWVGSPPFRFKSMSADMLAFNEMYREAVEAVGGKFVDVWDGFVDEDGNYSRTGSDIKGQTVSLRSSDGINFTNAGRRKLAFYVERQLKLMLGEDAAPLLTSLAPDALPVLTLPPLQTESELVRTNPISLADPEIDGGSILLGETITLVEDTGNPLRSRSPRQRLVQDGTAPPERPGRAGSYGLAGGQGGAQAGPVTPPMVLLPEAPVF